MTWSSMAGRVRLQWLRLLGRASGINPAASLELSVELQQAHPCQIAIGPRVHIGRYCWLHVCAVDAEVHLRIDPRTSIGRHNVISAKNSIWIGADCVTAPNVLIMDHGHEYRNPD